MSSTTSQELTEWLRGFPAEKVKARVEELQELMVAHSAEMATLRDWLALYERAAPSLPAQPNPELPKVDVPRDTPEPPPSYPPKRQVALGLLRERAGQAIPFADMVQILIERGAMGDAPNERHALRVALYKAFQRGEIERPSEGAYRLPRSEESFPLES